MQESPLRSSNIKVLKVQGVLDITSLSRASHFAKLNERSKTYDPTYPKPLKLGARSVGYIEQEVINWVEARMEERV